MSWSYTGYRQFRQCRRKWYYSNIVANGRAKGQYRREITALSKLKSLEAWRGDVVDYVIGFIIIPKIKNRKDLNYDDIVYTTNKLADRQLECAKNKLYRQEGIEIKAGEFGALFAYEHNSGITQEEFDQARQEILISLKNFLEREELIEYLKEASNLIAQRKLTYKLNEFSVNGRPDLIAFFTDEAPHIFDWKVHQDDTTTYEDQLLSYAIALKNVKPHKDFPQAYTKHDLKSYRLTEYQLLTNEIREYSILMEDIERMKSEINSGLLEMYFTNAHLKFDQTELADFSIAYDASHCEKCQYKSVCKNE